MSIKSVNQSRSLIEIPQTVMSEANMNNGDESVTMGISNVVKTECITDFELWLKEIQKVVKTYKGYLTNYAE